LALALEKIALEDEYFVSRKLYPNVDFYSGIVQRALGIPVAMFTCIFSLARTVGWIAQWQEMISDPEYKIGRPRQLYRGAARREVVPVAQREPRAAGRAIMMRQLLANSYLFGGNAPFIEELYEQYLANPGSVAHEWREYFDAMQVLPGGADGKDVAHAPVVQSFVQRAKAGELGGRAPAVSAGDDRLNLAALLLVIAYRITGSPWAALDPLKPPPPPPSTAIPPEH